MDQLGQQIKRPPKKEEKKVEKKEPPPPKKEKEPIPVPSPPPEVSKAPKKRLKPLDRQTKRVEKMFGKEKLNDYIDRIKEAIEKLGSDKLYEFVKKHREYGDEGNKYTNWNKDFCEYFGLKLKPKVKPITEHMRYAAALQIYLRDYFKGEVTTATDLFQARKGRMALSFIYLDGKIGGYTMSALGEYWNHRYFPKQKGEKEKPKLERASLGKEFKKKGNRQAAFDVAMTYLDAQLKGEKVVPEVAKAEGAPEEEPKRRRLAGTRRKLTPEELKQIDEAADAGILADRMTTGAYWQGQYWRVKNLQEKFKKEVQAIYSSPTRDPDIPGIGVYLNNLDGSWPQLAFDDYEKKWGESEADQKQLDDDLMDRLNHLKDVVGDYHRLVNEIFKRTKNKYYEKFAQFLREHSLPKGFNVKDTEPTKTETTTIPGTKRSRTHEYANPQLVSQRSLIEKPDLKGKAGIDGFYSKFFSKKPTKVIDSWEDFQTLLKDPKDSSIERLLKYFNLKDNEENRKKIREQVNQAILLRNMYLTHSEFIKVRKEFKKDLDRRYDLLNDSYNLYYATEVKNKDDVFISSLIQSADKNLPKIALSGTR